MSSRHKSNLRVEPKKFTTVALKTSLQKPSLSSLSLHKEQSKLDSQISSENTPIKLKKLSSFSHKLTKFPIHLQGETKRNSFAQKKQSSHNNSCGCPVCSKPARLIPTVQRAKHNQYFTPIKSSPLQTNVDHKLAVKNNFSAEKSNKGTASHTTIKNSNLVDKKATPMIQGGFFSKIKRGLKKFGKKVKRGLSKVGKKIKKIGNYVWSGVKWFSKQLWSKLKGIFFRSTRFTDL